MLSYGGVHAVLITSILSISGQVLNIVRFARMPLAAFNRITMTLLAICGVALIWV